MRDFFGAKNPFFGKHHSKQLKLKESVRMKALHAEGRFKHIYIDRANDLRKVVKSRGFKERMSIRMSGNNNPACRPEVRLKLSGANHWNWKGGITAIRFGLHIYGVNWKKARKDCLIRDAWRCRVKGCEAKHIKLGGTFREVAVHHMLPHSQGGSNALSNLITLCNKHHVMFSSSHPIWSSKFQLLELRKVADCILRFPRILPRLEKAA